MDDRARDALERISARLPSLTRGRVLDLGCGEGRFLPARGVGLDIDMERLRVARGASRLVVRADARCVPFASASFDTVYANRMLNDTGDVDRVLSEIARVLRPSGRLLVLTRARSAQGDRLDRANGTERLLRHFARVDAELDPTDDRIALFIAEGRRSS